MTTENSNPGTQTTEPPEWYKNPPEWMKSAPPSQSQTPPSSPPQGGGNDAVIAHLNALPEKIVNGLREAFQPPKNPQQPTAQTDDKSKSSDGQNSSTGSQAGDGKTPGKPEGKTRGDRFRDWWWNG